MYGIPDITFLSVEPSTVVELMDLLLSKALRRLHMHTEPAIWNWVTRTRLHRLNTAFTVTFTVLNNVQKR